jgi:chromosome segregation ATPase
MSQAPLLSTQDVNPSTFVAEIESLEQQDQQIQQALKELDDEFEALKEKKKTSMSMHNGQYWHVGYS